MAKPLSAAETARRLAALGLATPQAGAFAFRDQARGVRYDWHAHEHHQLLYSFRGTVHLESGPAAFLLPPHRAAFLPAGLLHRTRIEECDSGSVFFSPAAFPLPADRLRILAAPPLLAEMLGHAMRWGPRRDPADPAADRFFAVLADLCAEWLTAEMPFRLPRTDDAAISRALAYAHADLARANAPGAARAAHLSARSFRRAFPLALGLTWREYLLQARLLAALDLLAAPGSTITAVAAEVGFTSASAFAREFARLTGESPRDYRKRLTGA